MHFGDYLVSRKVLSAHQVLKALAEQNRQRKFLPLLLVDLGAMEDYRVLKYCKRAQERNEDFLDVLLEERYISKTQHRELRATWMNSGPPLGKILVSLGFMDESTKEALLAEFEAEKALEANLARLV